MCMPGSFLTPEEERLKVFWDYNNVLATAEREGFEKGWNEGWAEGCAKGQRTALTKQVLAQKTKGKSPSEIADILEIDIKMVEEILEGSC